MRDFVAFVVGSMLATTAVAQVEPPRLPRNPPLQRPQAPQEPSAPGTVSPRPNPSPRSDRPVIVQPQGQAVRPIVPAANAGVFFPELVVTAAPRFAGETSVLRVSIAGLNSARAAHVLDFAAGCGFAKTSRIDAGDHPLFLVGEQSLGRFSSDRTARYQRPTPGRTFSISQFNGAGVPVAADGTVKFALAGRAGIGLNFHKESPVFDGDSVARASESSDVPGAGYTPFLHELQSISPEQTRNGCVAEAMIMVQGGDSVWRMADSTGSWKPVAEVTQPKVFRSRPYFLASHRRVTIEDTTALRALLNPQVKPLSAISLSACGGTSVGPLASYPVGVQARGKDIAFVIRSGPLATQCTFVTQPGVLPEGVRIVSATYSVSRVGDRCHYYTGTNLANGLTLAAQTGMYFFSSMAMGSYFLATGEIPRSSWFDPINVRNDLKKQVLPIRLINLDEDKIKTYERLSVHGFENPYVLPTSRLTGISSSDAVREAAPSRRGYDLFEPMGGLLFCQETAINDHEIAITLDRVVADVPEGVRFPQ